MAWITVTDVKQYLDISDSVTSEDDFLLELATAAQNVVTEYTGHTFSSADTSAYYNGTGLEFLYIKAPIISLSTVKYAGSKSGISTATALTETDDYVYYPQTGRIELTSGTLFPFGAQNIYVEYVYGYNTVPSSVKQATIEIAVKAYKDHRKGRFGVFSKTLDSQAAVREIFTREFLATSTKAILDLYTNPFDEVIPFEL